ncbi:MAG: DegV family protein [Clostridium sp.]|nr:DegV family protein [Clostridium sp.]
MGIRIICDSASDITREVAKELNIKVLPIKTIFGEDEYLDGVNLSHKEFFEKLEESDNLPTTSQITPYDYEEAFKEAVESGDTVVCITMSSKLSGCNQSANIAAADYLENVFVVDSENVCIGEQILVKLAVNLRDEGKTASEIAEILDKEKKNIRLIAILDTLEYLKKGGRISSTAAFAGTLLGIKPLVAVEDGTVVSVGKARGLKSGNNTINKLIEKEGGIDSNKPSMLAYSGLSDEMLKKYIDGSKDIYEYVPSITTIGCAIGTHAGPGAIAVAFFKNN